MIDREHDLPITKQAEVLRISRERLLLPRPVPEADHAGQIIRAAAKRRPQPPTLWASEGPTSGNRR